MNMTPGVPMNGFASIAGRDAECAGEIGDGFAGSVSRPHSNHVGLSELGPAVQGTNWVPWPGSTLGVPVGIILAASAQKQVIRTDASWDVAFVADAEAFGDCAEREDPRGAMRVAAPRSLGCAAVAAITTLVDSPHPKPTTVTLLNAFPHTAQAADWLENCQ